MARAGFRVARGRPGRWQRPPLVALAAALALLVIGIGLAVANEQAYDVRNLDQARSEARLLSALLAPILDAGDRVSAARYLQALGANRNTEAAAVYGPQGRRLASYARAGGTAPPALSPLPGAVVVAGGRLGVTLPIADNGKRLGSLYLATATEPLGSRLRRYIGLGLLATMASLLVFVLASAHAALTRANNDLERRAVDLAAANQQLRSQMEEREKAEMALRQSQKMEAIGRLTGGVAHDFNNLMTVVSGNLELIEHLAKAPADGILASERLLRLVAAAQRGLRRGEQLTRQLLALSRQQPLEARVVDVNAAILDFAPLIQRAIGETMELRLRLGAGQWRCKLDPAQFETAMLNLAINARDAADDSGSLTIASGLASPAPPDAPAAEPAAHVVVSVTDTGSGMPSEVLARAFEPFYTTKPVGKGSGLGLAQVWTFVTQSGGRIAINSEPGLGTVFRLYFPLSAQPRDAPDDERAAPAEPLGTERILIVEDEEDVRLIAAATLDRLGYRTAVAPDGPEALAMLDDGGGFDLLFADYVMPNGLNGAELAREACRRRPQLRVLLTSGYTGQNAPRGGEALLDGFPLIAKPYRSADLADRIRRILDAAPAVPAG